MRRSPVRFWQEALVPIDRPRRSRRGRYFLPGAGRVFRQRSPPDSLRAPTMDRVKTTKGASYAAAAALMLAAVPLILAPPAAAAPCDHVGGIVPALDLPDAVEQSGSHSDAGPDIKRHLPSARPVNPVQRSPCPTDPGSPCPREYPGPGDNRQRRHTDAGHGSTGHGLPRRQHPGPDNAGGDLDVDTDSGPRGRSDTCVRGPGCRRRCRRGPAGIWWAAGYCVGVPGPPEARLAGRTLAQSVQTTAPSRPRGRGRGVGRAGLL